MQQAKIEF